LTKGTLSKHPLMQLLPEQSRAARALLDWTQTELARRAGVSRSTVRDFEGGRHALSPASEAQIVAVFEGAGVDLLPPGALGPGVRLRRALPPALKGDPCSSS
jgi:transcriptional regulator with XRE-family HTH domain